MESGPELDRLVAEKVMGWRIVDHEAIGGCVEVMLDSAGESHGTLGWYQPSEQIDDTIGVIHRLTELGLPPIMTAHEGYFKCGIPAADIECRADTLALAVCAAAVAAVESRGEDGKTA